MQPASSCSLPPANDADVRSSPSSSPPPPPPPPLPRVDNFEYFFSPATPGTKLSCRTEESHREVCWSAGYRKRVEKEGGGAASRGRPPVCLKKFLQKLRDVSGGTLSADPPKLGRPPKTRRTEETRPPSPTPTISVVIPVTSSPRPPPPPPPPPPVPVSAMIPVTSPTLPAFATFFRPWQEESTAYQEPTMLLQQQDATHYIFPIYSPISPETPMTFQTEVENVIHFLDEGETSPSATTQNDEPPPTQNDEPPPTPNSVPPHTPNSVPPPSPNVVPPPTPNVVPPPTPTFSNLFSV